MLRRMHLLLVCGLLAVSTAAPAGAQTMRVSVKRVFGSQVGTTGVAAPASDWAGPLGTTRIVTMANDAATILGSAGFSLQFPSGFTFTAADIVDILDPGYPWSFYDVELGTNEAIKHAMEAACEIDPLRYAYDPQAINIYLVNRINRNALGGSCSFPIGVPGVNYPDEDDIIFVSSQVSTAPALYYASTMAHEIGHYFGLLHPNAVQGAAEAVSCGTTLSCGPLTIGDFVADTPGDPWVTGATAGAQIGALFGAAGYASCISRATTLATNPMASYYALPAASFPVGETPTLGAMTFTCGQLVRLGTYAAQRSRVDGTTPVAQINTVAAFPGVPSIVTVTGVNLPTSASGSLDVTLGRIKWIPPGMFFVPEQVSTLALEITAGADILATFASLPPGRHTVCIRVNGQTFAASSSASTLDVLPLLAVTPQGTTEFYNVTLLTSAPNTPVVFGVEAAPTPPPPLPLPAPSYPIGLPAPPFAYELLLNFGNPTALLTLTSDATGRLDFLPALSSLGLPSGMRHYVQFGEAPGGGAPGLTNVFELWVP